MTDPICAVCNKKLTNSCYVHNFWDYGYCKRHEGRIPFCYSCGRMISPLLTYGGMLYRDGRMMCNLCRRTALDKISQAQPTIAAVRNMLGRFTIDLKDEVISVRLADQAEINHLADGGYANNPVGIASLTSSTKNGKTVRTMQEIVILYGLPIEHFAAVLAHEFGHAWIWMNDYPLDLPPNVNEGLCQLFAFVWLRQRRNRHSSYLQHLMQKDQDKIYGESFRLAYFQFKKRRLLALLQYVKENKNFPPN